MSKNFLLITGNYYPESIGIGRYNAEMIDWLTDHGFSCTVICTYPYYPQWEVLPSYKKKKRWYSQEKRVLPSGKVINIWRCPHYIPGNLSGKNRILSDVSFFFSMFFRLPFFLFFRRFDYIMNVSPPLLPGLLAIWLRKKSTRFLYHIQDLQAEMAEQFKMLRSSAVFSWALKVENQVLKKADVVSTISKGMQLRMQKKTVKPVLLFANWANTQKFLPLQNKQELKSKFGFDPSKTLVIYSGAIGEKQGLELVLPVAQNLTKYEKLQFIISGSGPYLNKLKDKARLMQLTNIVFQPLQPEEDLNEFLNIADIHLVIQKNSANDLVMPSKLNNILAVGGIAIVTANKGSALYNVITENNMGITCEPENLKALEAVIINTCLHPNAELGKNARCYAEKVLSIEHILPQYIEEAGLSN